MKESRRCFALLLAGNIPLGLADLTGLVRLELDGNRLSGESTGWFGLGLSGLGLSCFVFRIPCLYLLVFVCCFSNGWRCASPIPWRQLGWLLQRHDWPTWYIYIEHYGHYSYFYGVQY